MERFENAILKQRVEINDRMVEVFELFYELTTSGASKKVLLREETRHPITKHVNSISLIRMEEEKSVKSNKVVDKNVMEPNTSDVAEPIKEEIEDGTSNELVKSAEKELKKNEREELVEMYSY
nr:hypothetical protein [Tanacetum cinerariifolium]